MSPTRRPFPLVALAAALALTATAAGEATAGEAPAVPAVQVPAGEVLERWLVGTLNGKPAFNLHGMVGVDPDGTRVASLDQHLVMRRQLPGAGEAVLTVRNTGRVWTDAAGRVLRFELDEDANGNRTVARGTIDGRAVTATVTALDRRRQVELELPEGRVFLDWRTELRAALAACRQVGDVYRSVNVAVVNGSLMLSRPVYELKAVEADGARVFHQTDESVPGFTITTVLAPDAEVRSMLMDLAVMKIDLKPAETAAVLAGEAEIDILKLFAAKGAPAPGGDNRYRLEDQALAAIAVDGFQSLADGVLTVRRECPPMQLEDPGRWLRATDQQELDAPELKDWVTGLLADAPEGTPERARVLCDAVRAHITRKNLEQGDASALATWRAKAGDCTEHATLLCAALRIAGIPARIECGVVHSPPHGGWVGHAWTAAWDAATGRWLHLDAAYPGIERSRYIGCAGDPDGPGGLGIAMNGALAGLAGTTIEALGRPETRRFR